MSKGFLPFILVTFVSGLVPIVALAFFKLEFPKPVSQSLGAILVVATGTKFWLSDKLSSDGFDVAKTAADIALALSGALFSLAVVQQFEADKAIFPAATMIFGGVAIKPTTAETQFALWLTAFVSALFVAAATALAIHGRKLRGQGGAAARLGSVLCRFFSVLLGSATYVMYLVVVLYKA